MMGSGAGTGVSRCSAGARRRGIRTRKKSDIVLFRVVGFLLTSGMLGVLLVPSSVNVPRVTLLIALVERGHHPEVLDHLNPF